MPEQAALLTSAEFWWELGIAATIIVAFALAARVFLLFLSSTVHRLTHATDTRVDDIILRALKGPLFWAITLVGVSVAQAQAPMLPGPWQAGIRRLLFVGFVLAAYVALYRLLRDLLDWYIHEKAGATETQLDDTLTPFLRRLLQVALTLGALVLILQYFAIPIGSFVATLGIGSLAVALAAQSVLGDIFAGFFIILDRRYRIGDRLELIDANLIGDVVDIGLRTTRILTMDYRMVIVPNSMLATNLVINHAYPDPNLRVDLPIGVAYGVDIRHAKAVLLNGIRHVDGVQQTRQPDIVVTGFGDSAINLEMRCWIDAYADKPKMVDRINEAAYYALTEAGIEIPFPQRTLWHRVEREAIPLLRAIGNGQPPELREPPAPAAPQEPPAKTM